MPGLVPGIPVFGSAEGKTWMAGINPAMTILSNCLAAVCPGTRRTGYDNIDYDFGTDSHFRH
jgi:hypothetical protein